MPVTLHIRNLRALRVVDWELGPVNVLVGANGTGKTTLVLALRLLRAAWDRDLASAVETCLGGSANLRTWGMTDDDEIELALTEGAKRWSIRLLPAGASVATNASEELRDGDEIIVSRNSLGQHLLNQRVLATPALAVRQARDASISHPALAWIASLLGNITAFYDYDLSELRDGSRSDQSRHLNSKGTNAATILKRWRISLPEEAKLNLLVGVLRAAFPRLIQRIGFDEAGSTVAARFQAPSGSEYESRHAANGLLSLLISGTAILESPDGGIVAIDEPETALHPWAIREFIAWLRPHAERRNLRVILTSHSPVLLNCFKDDPSCIWMTTDTPLDELPSVLRITDQVSKDWLWEMGLGDRLENGDLGTNEPS